MSQTYTRMPDAAAPPTRLNRAKERLRLATLAGLELLDTPPEKEFDSVVSLAREALGCKIGLISLIDEKRQWFKARAGINVTETPRKHAFCTYALEVDDMLVVPDATLDPRFQDNPLVTGKPSIRFYAGVPLKADIPGMGAGSAVIGTLCVADMSPHWLTHHEAQVLRKLAQYVETLIRERHTARTTARLAKERESALLEADLRGRQMRQAERVTKICSWRIMLSDGSAQWSDPMYDLFDMPRDGGPDLAAAMAQLPSPARDRIEAATQRLIHQHQPIDEEAEFVTRLGNPRRIRVLGQIETFDGKPYAMIGLTQELALHSQAKDASAWQDTRTPDICRQQLAMVERIANIGTWRVDVTDWSIQWSDQMFAIHGLPVGPAPSMDTAMTFYPPAAHTLLSTKLFDTISTGEPCDIVVDIVGSGGGKRTVRIVGEVEVRGDQPVAVIGMTQDVTGREEAAAAPRTANGSIPVNAAEPACS